MGGFSVLASLRSISARVRRLGGVFGNCTGEVFGGSICGVSCVCIAGLISLVHVRRRIEPRRGLILTLGQLTIRTAHWGSGECVLNPYLYHECDFTT